MEWLRGIGLYEGKWQSMTIFSTVQHPPTTAFSMSKSQVPSKTKALGSITLKAMFVLQEKLAAYQKLATTMFSTEPQNPPPPRHLFRVHRVIGAPAGDGLRKPHLPRRHHDRRLRGVALRDAQFRRVPGAAPAPAVADCKLWGQKRRGREPIWKFSKTCG